jgi:hypothetical protein
MKHVYADSKLGVRQTDTFEVPPGGGYGCTGGESFETEPIEPEKNEFFD